MKTLAIIGCGGIGTYHLEHFLEFHDIALVGFCDLIIERAETFVQKAGCGKAFSNYVQMYDELNPDMVFICVPPYCHGEIEFETIKRGIPMFVEKPVSLDLELAYAIRDAVAKKGLITAVGFQCRYSNIVSPTQEFARRHPIVYVGCERMGGLPDVHWWRVKSQSGGQIVEQTVHQFDMIRYIMGEPEEVFTLGARGFITDVENYDTDDLSTTAIRFASGALGCISTGCYAESGEAYDSKITFSAKDARLDHYIIGKVRIYGEQAEAGSQENGLIFSGDGTMQAGSSEAIVIKDDDRAGVLCDRTFIDAVISGDGSKILSPYADAVHTLEFVLACNRSMEKNAPVKVGQ